MKIKLFKKPHRFRFRRIFLPLVIIPLILFVVLSAAVFFVSRDQLQKTGQMSVEKFRIQMEIILNELKLVNDSLVDDEYFLSLINSDVTDGLTNSSIVRTLAQRLHNSMYVQEILLISKSHDKTYTGLAHYDYASYISLLHGLNAIPDSVVGFTEKDLEEGWNHPVNSYSSPYYVSFIEENGERNATLVVILDKSSLYRSIVAVNTDFCCMFNEDFMISSVFNPDPSIDYTSKKDITRLIGQPVELFMIRTDSYTYVTALSSTDFYRPIYIILAAFILYFLFVLLFSIIYISTVNKREKEFFASIISELPKPVPQGTDIDDIFISIQNAFDDYKTEHSAFSEQQKYNNLSRLCQGYLGSSIDDETAMSMGLDTETAGYYLIRIHIDETGIMNSAHRLDLTSIIIETSMNGFADGRFRSVCFYHHHDDICGFINLYDGTVDAEFIKEVLDNVQRLLAEDYGITVLCSLSTKFSSLSDAPAAFQETIELFRFVRSIDSNARFVSAERLKTSPSFLVRGEFLKQLQILSGTLLVGKYDIISDMVDRILEEHVAPIRKNYNLAEERLACIKTMLYESSLPAWLSEEETDRIRTRLKASDSISSLSEAVHICFEPLKDHKDDNSLVNKACEYIQDNISNVMLSVPEIADATGVSVQHLSKLFKADKSMTMVEYINQYRIHRAQELLTDTACTVTEIAEQTGYTNNVTFTRNFKKYVGCTPSEYRIRNS